MTSTSKVTSLKTSQYPQPLVPTIVTLYFHSPLSTHDPPRNDWNRGPLKVLTRYPLSIPSPNSPSYPLTQSVHHPIGSNLITSWSSHVTNYIFPGCLYPITRHIQSTKTWRKLSRFPTVTVNKYTNSPFNLPGIRSKQVFSHFARVAQAKYWRRICVQELNGVVFLLNRKVKR